MDVSLVVRTVLRTDDAMVLEPGAINAFSLPGSVVLCDTQPIWLAQEDWTALAEIEVLAQARAAGRVSGTFRVCHVYQDDEQRMLTAVFRRMHAGREDPNIYVLVSEVEHMVAMEMGVLLRLSLEHEGFLHASPAEQLTRVANKHYQDAQGTRVLVIPQDRVRDILRWEPAAGSLYPHLYGPLEMDAVLYAVPAPRFADGRYRIVASDLSKARAIAAPLR